MDKKSIFLALFIFIIMLLAFYFSFSEISITPEPTVVEEERMPAEELEEVRLSVYNDQQSLKLELQSQKVENFKEEKLLKLQPIEVEVYSTESGKLLYTLNGDQGSYYSERQYLAIRGNVVIDSEQYQIQTAELDYYLERNYLQGSGSVKISSADFYSTAQSFSSDLNLKDLSLSKAEAENKVKINFNNFGKQPQTEESNDE